jgi:hypothetical protein
MTQTTADPVRHSREWDPQVDDAEPGPGWSTVLVVVALLCFAALPRSIVLTGFSPVIIVASAVVLVLWRFGRE